MVNNIKLLKILYSLGAHIGHNYTNFNSMYQCLTVGVNRKTIIFDLTKTIFFLKRSLLFIKTLTLTHGSIIFYCGFNFNNPEMQEILYTIYHLVYVKKRQSFFYEKWNFGQLTNARYTIKPILKELFSSRVKTQWYVLLFKVIVYSIFKQIDNLKWVYQFKRLLKFWRLFYFFKFFNNYFTIPSAGIVFNSIPSYSIITEFNKLSIPVISTLDSNNLHFNITYPIPSNDDSILLTFFYMNLFSNLL